MEGLLRLFYCLLHFTYFAFLLLSVLDLENYVSLIVRELFWTLTATMDIIAGNEWYCDEQTNGTVSSCVLSQQHTTANLELQTQFCPSSVKK